MKKDTNKKESKKESKKITVYDVNDLFAVSRVNNYSDECTFFTLIVKAANDHRVVIDGCKVLTGKDGEDFIAFPDRKVDDKYYHIAFVNLNDEDKEAIIDKIVELI